MLIPRLSHSRSQVEQGRAAGDADNDRFMEGLHHADGIEACRPFVGNGIASDIGMLAEVMDDRGIAATWTDNGMTDAMSNEQGCQDIDVLFVGEHFSL